MLVALAAKIELPRDEAHGVSFNPHHPIKVDGKTERLACIFVHYRKRMAFKDRMPVLILDASGDAGGLSQPVRVLTEEGVEHS